MQTSKIIKIDQEKCIGCGLCIPNCAKGAIKLIDGKAKLIDANLCDGLGMCLGHCPQGAITIEEREEKTARACPGAKIIDFRKQASSGRQGGITSTAASQLGQWPIQLRLVPAFAPFLDNADLLIAADCVPFAFANFHQQLLIGKILLVGCPKFDDLGLYKEKLAQVFQNNIIKSVTYAHMEVPCCSGLIKVIQEALAQAKKEIPYIDVVIGINGERR